MSNGITASSLANFCIRSGIFSLNHSGIYTSSPLYGVYKSGNPEGYGKLYSLNNLSSSIRFFNSTLNSLNALYDTNSENTHASSQPSLAKLTLALFSNKTVNASHAYAKYEESAQRLGLPVASFNLNFASLAARNIYQATALPSSFLTGSSAAARPRFFGSTNAFVF